MENKINDPDSGAQPPVPKIDRRSITSRLNAQKSTGPKSPAGKARSSRNATRPGLLARAIVLEGECIETFQRLVDDLTAEFNPRTPAELALVETMAAANWRRNRLLLFEKANLEREIRSQQGELASDTHPIRASHAFVSLCNKNSSIALINRCETRYNREFTRAIQRLLDLRNRRRPAPRELAE